MDRIIKVHYPRPDILNDRWIWKIAWRDAKKNGPRLLLFISSIVIGIAALVAINSFNNNLDADIDNQARALLGADIVLYSDDPFGEADSIFFNKLTTEQASEARFNSMAHFTVQRESRLAQITALKGNYPFYGEMETVPPFSIENFRNGNTALIDETIALQFNINVYDTVKVGELSLPVVGFVTKKPGNVKIASTFAPGIYIPFDSLKRTNLITTGSRIKYRKYFKIAEDKSVSRTLNDLKPAIRAFGFSWETIQYRKENLGKSFKNLYKFLNLLGFIALVLGCVGAASSVQIYLREKTGVIAILKCLGAPGEATFLIFFIQTIILGIIGSILGVTLGSFIQALIPYALKDFLPINLSYAISWPSILFGLFIGFVISILFSLLPLFKIKNISPILAFRANIEVLKVTKGVQKRVVFLIILTGLGLAIYQTQSIVLGAIFSAAIVFTFFILSLIARLLLFITGRLLQKKMSFVWQQSMSNLFRPNNQTLILIVVIGLGTFLISTLDVIQNGILRQVEFIGASNRSNLVLFDIQPDQKEKIDSLTQEYDLATQQLVPIITLRFQKIRNKSINEIKNDPDDDVPNGLLYWEHMVTYRDELLPTESISKGRFTPVIKNQKDSIFITVAESMASLIHVDLGDEIVFNVHGLPLKTYVGGVVKTDWQRIQNNFMFIFPAGVLERAPQYYALLAKSPDKNVTAAFQQNLARNFPNVSSLDLRIILRTLDEIIDKISFVVRFMALFSIVTGLIVLAGAISNSKYARIKENTLLRTLGALKKQLKQITIIEYAYLGLFAGATGTFLAVFASWGLSIYFFDIIFLPNFFDMAGTLAVIISSTILVGWLNTRRIIKTPPLEVLRKEV
ncbi:ABC transporter permease [Fulvivirgaceae bacterium BMA10]|uniref:ABC transporter permease n=1 Tax=Splendidivirga corallicola TaxID=3051826 RepID=A0ABT8KKT2_9BACT|nr:ABC transporter permease [Fulvivirgaceae bacterium BMA10]